MIISKDISEFEPSEHLVIWDVRDADKYTKGHINHALNVPVDTIDETLLNQSEGDIYVLCGGGTKAQKACERLQALNPNRTYIHLMGGTRKAEALGWQLE